LIETIQPSEHHYIGTTYAREDRWRPAHEAELHIAADQGGDGSATDIDRF
jgi:hypothetical protein